MVISITEIIIYICFIPYSTFCYRKVSVSVLENIVINGKPFLLIPKEITQTRYRFTTDNFLRSVIVENICEETATYDDANKKVRQPKDKVREKLIRENGTVFNTIINHTAKNQSLLNQYNKIVKEKYKSLMLSDETLDNILYN